MTTIKIANYDFISPDEYHVEWQSNRLKYLINNYNEDFWNNKKILELGSYNGAIGNFLKTNFNCDVTSVEGRESNVKSIKNYFPDLNIIQYDLDTKKWDFDKYDIIINWGLYYHLKDFHYDNLINCVKNCKTLFFETVVFDCDESIIHYVDSVGNDQGLTETGGYPTINYINNVLRNNSIDFKLIESKELNGKGHNYDWIPINSKKFDFYKRKFWIINNYSNEDTLCG